MAKLNKAQRKLLETLVDHARMLIGSTSQSDEVKALARLAGRVAREVIDMNDEHANIYEVIDTGQILIAIPRVKVSPSSQLFPVLQELQKGGLP